MNNDQATNFRHYPRRHHPGPQPAGLAQLHRRSGRSGLVDLSICAVGGMGSQAERNRPEDWTMTTRREVSRRETADIEWQRERDCAKRKQRYLKHLRKIHKKKAAPNGNSEAATKK